MADDKIVPTLAVHLRGSYLSLGQPVERGFPEVMRTSFTPPILPANTAAAWTRAVDGQQRTSAQPRASSSIACGAGTRPGHRQQHG
ncbi:MAG: hypothetical protein WDN28_01695 [Chthoniobacter sp.]